MGSIFDNGLGGLVSSFLGSKNEASAASQTGAPEVNADSYEYGGQPGGAAAHAAAYGATSGAAQLRTGPQADYNQANWDRQNAGQARVGQQQIADQISMRARGQSPQIATMIANRQRNQAMAAQGSLAASARGPAGLALANQTAANNMANASGAISGQEQINAANEQRADEAGALGAYGSIRGGDLASQGQAAQQAQYQAQLEAQQRALNDQRSLGYSQLENTVNTTQLQAQAQRQAQEASNKLNAAQINAGVAGQNAATNQQNGLGTIGLVSNTATGFATGGGTPPPKAKGGPVAGRHPYLVGEEGPELVVPHRSGGGPVMSSRGFPHETEPYLVGVNGPEIRTFPHDGTVVPAPETAAILAPSTWGRGAGMTETDLGTQQGRNYANATRAEFADATRDAQPGPQAVASPIEVQRMRDEERVRQNEAYRANEAPLSESDEREERLARRRLGHDKAQAKKPPAAPSPTPSRVGSMLSSIGTTANDMAGKIDTRYHAPTLMSPGTIQIGTRAAGGPVEASSFTLPPLLMRPASMAPQTSGMVDIGSGSGMSGAQILAASTGRTGNPMVPVGGGGVVGGTNVPGYSAREDGGPVGPSYEFDAMDQHWFRTPNAPTPNTTSPDKVSLDRSTRKRDANDARGVERAAQRASEAAAVQKTYDDYNRELEHWRKTGTSNYFRGAKRADPSPDDLARDADQRMQAMDVAYIRGPSVSAREGGGPVGPSFESRQDRQEMKDRELRFRYGTGPLNPPKTEPAGPAHTEKTPYAAAVTKEEDDSAPVGRAVGTAHLLVSPVSGLLSAIGDYVSRRACGGPVKGSPPMMLRRK